MSPLFSVEPKRLDIIAHLEEFRRRIIFSVLVFLFLSVIFFANGGDLLYFVQKPSFPAIDGMVFLAPAEVFTSYLKMATLAGFILAFPVILYEIWAFVSPAVRASSRKRVGAWFFLSLFLFSCGVCFSYFIAMPIALKFLINFGLGTAAPMITLGNYISFFCAVVLAGGAVFQIPIAMAALTEASLIGSSFLAGKRPYALIVIMVTAAIITPTQDITNMLIFAIPMLLLYEVGIMISRAIENRRNLSTN